MNSQVGEVNILEKLLSIMYLLQQYVLYTCIIGMLYRKLIPQKKTKMSATIENIQIGIMVEVPEGRNYLYTLVQSNQTIKPK